MLVLIAALALPVASHLSALPLPVASHLSALPLPRQPRLRNMVMVATPQRPTPAQAEDDQSTLDAAVALLPVEVRDAADAADAYVSDAYTRAIDQFKKLLFLNSESEFDAGSGGPGFVPGGGGGGVSGVVSTRPAPAPMCDSHAYTPFGRRCFFFW